MSAFFFFFAQGLVLPYHMIMAMSCSYSRYDTPLGVLLVAADADGITDLAIGARESEFVRAIAARCGVAPALDKGRFPELEPAFEDYFTGRPVSFEVPLKPFGTAFDRLVWSALSAIPWGAALSYGELAEAIGKPGAARAVGGACARNPIPIIIPCHRVLQSGGLIGGYSGGAGVKEKLLVLEGIPFKGR